MPVSWRVDVHAQRAFLCVSDPYTLDEWRQAMLGIVNTPELSCGFTLLVDRRGSSPPSTPFVEAMTGFFKDYLSRLSGAKAAVIVDSEAGYGMARMTSLLAEIRASGYLVEVFKDPAVAERWLGS